MLLSHRIYFPTRSLTVKILSQISRLSAVFMNMYVKLKTNTVSAIIRLRDLAHRSHAVFLLEEIESVREKAIEKH